MNYTKINISTSDGIFSVISLRDDKTKEDIEEVLTIIKKASVIAGLHFSSGDIVECLPCWLDMRELDENIFNMQD